MNIQDPSVTQDQDELYDEFGNYIGPDLDSSDDDDDEDDDDEEEEDEDGDDNRNVTTDDDSSNYESNRSNMIIEHDPSNADDAITAASQNQIVLHEDKVHYPSAESIYGPNVTTAVIDEDAMDIETPIIAPTNISPSMSIHGPASMAVAPTTASGRMDEGEESIIKDDYLVQLVDGTNKCSRSRGIAICGKLQCGKSSFIDLLRSHTLIPSSSSSSSSSTAASTKKKTTTTESPVKYTHRLVTEQKHNMTLSSTPLTLPLTNSNGQTYAFTIMDTPGHIQFHDETIASLALMDGCVLNVDVVEGVTYMDEIILSSCLSHGLPIVVMLHKIDKLILDLKLPLNDAYMKIRNVLDSINVYVRGKAPNGTYPLFSPLHGNVLFGSSMHGYVFSLDSMVDLYMDHMIDLDEDDGDDSDVDMVDEEEEENDNDDDDGYNATLRNKKQTRSAMFGSNFFGTQTLTKDELKKRLWGNTYYNSKTRTFSKKPTSSVNGGDKRTFCTFILEPLYKLYSLCLGEKEKEVNKVLRSLGIHLSKDQLRSDVHILLNIVMKKFFCDCRSFVDMVVKNV